MTTILKPFQKFYKLVLEACKNSQKIPNKGVRKPIIKLLFMRILSLHDLDETILYVLKLDSNILEIIQLVATFREILSGCNLNALD